MKLKILSLSSLVVLALALCASVTTTTASPKSPTTPAVSPSAVPQPAATPAAQREAHPEIREAMESLRRAKDHLEHAAHDFGGHRVEAIKAIDESIRQLQDCLKFDK